MADDLNRAQWDRIKPSDLRVECKACGGSGRKMVPTTPPQAAQIVRTYAGPCPRCNGTGRVLPAKVDI